MRNSCSAPKCGCYGREGWHEDKTDRLPRQITKTERAREFEERLEKAMAEVKGELTRAYAAFPVDFRSAHEGVAIIEEEFMEFREASFWPHKDDTGDEEEEALQLAAMSIRYLIDVCYQKDVPR